MTYFWCAAKCARCHALVEITGHALVKWPSQSREMTRYDAMNQLINLWGVFVRTVVVCTSIGAVGTFAVLRLHLSWDLALPNRLNKCTIVRAVLLGICRGKFPDRLIKAFACSKVTRNHGRVA